MSDIPPIQGSISPSVTQVEGVSHAGPVAESTQPSAVDAVATDRVELSDTAQILARLENLPIRQDLVNSVREQLAAGTYETDAKLEAALAAAIDDITEQLF